MRNSAKYNLLGSRSDVTVVARPLIFETRSQAKMVAILVRFSVLQRGIKIQGFDQIQKFLRRNTHQSMTIFLGEKKLVLVQTHFKHDLNFRGHFVVSRENPLIFSWWNMKFQSLNLSVYPAALILTYNSIYLHK